MCLKMIEFTDDFRERMRHKLSSYSHADSLGSVRGTVTVSTVKRSDLDSETFIQGSAGRLLSGEGNISPLAYFLSGMTICQSIHFAEWASTSDIKVESLVIEAKGEFSVSRPRSFIKIDYLIKIESEESQERIMGLISRATSDCFVTNTLKKACEVTGLISINGKQPLEITN